MTNLINKSIIAALSLMFVMAFSPIANAAENPFGMSNVDATQMQVAENGKCGEGKCGGEKKSKCGEGKCGGDKKEGKCGEGKCGGDKKEGKCGGDKKESKCGEGKCGGK